MSSDSEPSSPADRLAALRDGGRAAKAADRPRRLKLDAGITVELPSPRVLARVYALPILSADAEVYARDLVIVRRQAGTAAEPQVTPSAILVDELRASLEALPDRDDAGRPYRDLRIYLRDGDPVAVATYLYDTVKAARIAAPKWRPRVERQEREAPKTPTERQQESRPRLRAREIASAECFLQLWQEDADPGDRIEAPELYEEAAEEIGQWVKDAKQKPVPYAKDVERYGLPDKPRCPGPRTFYEVADKKLGPRVRGAQGVRVYVVSSIAADLIARTEHMNDQEEKRAA
ncbi:DUF2390 domain-containing protein [Planosporangium flavigriseum]|uniref:Uncharacterized protein n=1 Tax=Planosporangium flavigriseum TaxID=373681 RepID=A0A8J3LT43_9ACTN|nr:DUF2390 domain-containing protein [Planosporangium flavigriseum]NJC66478.1 DUF2390 domain-containing protein [Planosporangium flavigriseum]GIG76355.1 hypothetical protein Pfl04_47590 [Planosporangium flavigriseum]